MSWLDEDGWKVYYRCIDIGGNIYGVVVIFIL